MQLSYLDLFELCYIDLIQNAKTKQSLMNSPIGKLSAVAVMFQCSSNKKRIMCEINLKGKFWVLLDFNYCINFKHIYLLFCKQGSLLTAIDYLLNR